jgi:hypothetical protein
VEEATWGVVHLAAQLTACPTSSELLTPGPDGLFVWEQAGVPTARVLGVVCRFHTVAMLNVESLGSTFYEGKAHTSQYFSGLCPTEINPKRLNN